MESEQQRPYGIKDTNFYSMLEEIVNYIKESKLAIGDKLPSENILAEKIHINRSTLREALRVLEAFGVISSRRGSGNIYVCDLERGYMTLFMLSNSLLNDKQGINNLRAVIEADAISEFIKNATDYDLFRLKMIYREQLMTVRDARTQEYLTMHLAFHDQLMKYGVTDAAKRLVHSGIRLIDNDRVARYRMGQSLIKTDEDYFRKARAVSHEAILNAVEEKNIEKARSLIVQHILIPAEIEDTL